MCADRYINQLDEDPNGPNVQPGDIIPVVRGSATFRARFGDSQLPTATSAQAGRHLAVNTEGKPAWTAGSASVVRETIYASTSGGGALNTNLRLSTGKRFDQFPMFQVALGWGSNASTNWAWLGLSLYSATSTRYFISTIEGSDWSELVTTGNDIFVLTSSNSSVRIHRIEALKF